MIVLFYCSYGSFFGMLCNTLSVFCLDLFIRVVFSTFGITLGVLLYLVLSYYLE